MKKIELKRFNWHRSVSKNKTVEIEGYNGKNIGLMINARVGYDHPGFMITVGLWYTIDIHFYDNRHQDEIQAEEYHD